MSRRPSGCGHYWYKAPRGRRFGSKADAMKAKELGAAGEAAEEEDKEGECEDEKEASVMGVVEQGLVGRWVGVPKEVWQLKDGRYLGQIVARGRRRGHVAIRYEQDGLEFEHPIAEARRAAPLSTPPALMLLLRRSHRFASG